MTLREIFGRLAAWRRRDELDRDLAADMDAHIELLARDLEHGGLPHADALVAARRQVGNVTVLREASRDFWGFPALEALLQDIRYALRGLRRSPGFTATVVITLGLGIGANAAMFGVIDRLMFRPYPYLRAAGEVNRVYLQTQYRRLFTTHVFQYTRYLDFASSTSAFSRSAAFTERRMAVGSGADTRERTVTGVSASYFGFFDARPAQGRFFSAADDVLPLGANVAVLSHAFWQSQFNGEDVVGKAIKVGASWYTIVGVAPERFIGVAGGEPPAVFVPITTVPANQNPSASSTYFTNYNWDWVEMLVRRKPGVSVEAASAALTAEYSHSRSRQRLQTPQTAHDSVARPTGFAGPLRLGAGPDAGLEARTLSWVMGVSVVVLLIACANVTNLMYSRVLRRRREISLRLALGVSRSRLLAQFLTESLLLSAFGCIAGIAIAQWGGGLLSLFASDAEGVTQVFTDWRILGAAAACAVAAGLFTTVGPTLLAMREDIARSLRAGAREGTYQPSRLRSTLLVAQAALSVLLLVGAGLFVRSLSNVRAMPLGYDADRVLMASPNWRGVTLDSAAQVAMLRRFLSAAQEIPGVAAASRVTGSRPFSTSTTGLFVDGIDSVSRLGRFNYQLVTPQYFAVMGTRILRGRPLTEDDREGTAPVAVVSQAMAGALWPGEDPVGKCLRVTFDNSSYRPGFDPSPIPCTTVVGVAENTVIQSLTDDQGFVYYMSIDQVRPAWGEQVLLRVAADDAAIAESIRRHLLREMPGDGNVVVTSVADVIDGQSRSWRIGATLFAAFGGLALIVAAVGLYGVISYNVAQRMHELGVRVALGAQSTDVVRLVVGQGARFAGAGVAIGLGLALASARWVQPLLFHQSATDVALYASVGGAMLLVAIIASLFPALRAAKADPNAALRAD